MSEYAVKRTIIYARSRGDEEALDRQVEACEAMAKRKGWRVERVVRDGSSEGLRGSLLGEILRADDIGRVVVFAPDRLARNIEDLERIQFVIASAHDGAEVEPSTVRAIASMARVEREGLYTDDDK